jgi:hypothetical protein
MYKIFLFLFCCIVLTIRSQDVNWDKNEIASHIKKGDTLKIVYDYSNMKVDTFLSEQRFIESTVESYNRKEPGRGNKWKADWFSDRVNMFQPKFETLFKKYLEKKTAYCVSCTNADFVVVIHTTRTHLGFGYHLIYSLFVWAAECDFEVTIYKADNLKDPIAHGFMEHLKGRDSGGYYYETGLRIAEAYARAGRAVGESISKAIN